MKKYSVSFIGKAKNAIGICYQITDTVEAENEKAAQLKLYEKYEHVSFPSFEVVE